MRRTLAPVLLSLLLGMPAGLLGQGAPFVPHGVFDGAVGYDTGRPGVVTLRGVDYPLPDELVPDDRTTTDFWLTPVGDILLTVRSAEDGAAPVCLRLGAIRTSRVSFHRLVEAPQPRLDEVAVECVAAPIPRLGTVGAPGGCPYTAFVAEAEVNGVVVLHWFDLTSTNNHAETQVRARLGGVTAAPDATIALVQGDANAAMGIDYPLIDLCPDRLGRVIGPAAGHQGLENEPYEAALVTEPPYRTVALTIGEQTHDVPAGSCQCAQGLFIGCEAVPVDPADSLVDFVFRYEAAGPYTDLVVSGTIPPDLPIVDDPVGIDAAGTFRLEDVGGSGEFTVRVDASGRFGYVCMGQSGSSPYAIQGLWSYTDRQGNEVSAAAYQSGGAACVRGSLPEVSKSGPAEVYELEPATYTLHYRNAGRLVARDVVIEDVVASHHDRFMWESEPGDGFSISPDDYAVFELGDLPGGSEGEAMFTIRPRCLASLEANQLVSTHYGIHGDPAPLSNRFNGYPDVVTTVLQLTHEPVDAALTVEPDPAGLAPGDTVLHTLSLTNVATAHPHRARVSLSLAPCFENVAVEEGADGVQMRNATRVSWADDIPANTTVRLSLSNRLVGCADDTFALNGGQPIVVSYGCDGETLVWARPGGDQPSTAEPGRDVAAPAPDAERDTVGGDPVGDGSGGDEPGSGGGCAVTWRYEPGVGLGWGFVCLAACLLGLLGAHGVRRRRGAGEGRGPKGDERGRVYFSP